MIWLKIIFFGLKNIFFELKIMFDLYRLHFTKKVTNEIMVLTFQYT